MNHALAFKLDMNQVFDKVKWSFLKAMMAKLGSSDQWIQCIMHYISTITCLCVLNGEVVSYFSLERGFH